MRPVRSSCLRAPGVFSTAVVLAIVVATAGAVPPATVPANSAAFAATARAVERGGKLKVTGLRWAVGRRQGACSSGVRVEEGPVRPRAATARYHQRHWTSNTFSTNEWGR